MLDYTNNNFPNATNIITNITYNQNDLDHDSEFLCPNNSTDVCALDQVCLNSTICSEDVNLSTYKWAVIAILSVLVLVNVVVGYRTYYRWRRVRDQENKDQTADNFGAEDNTANQKQNFDNYNHMEAIRINRANKVSSSSNSQQISTVSG